MTQGVYKIFVDQILNAIFLQTPHCSHSQPGFLSLLLVMALARRCCYEVAKLLCDSYSIQHVRDLLAIVPRDELVILIYDYLIELKHDSLALFIAFERVPYYFDQRVNVQELSVSDLVMTTRSSTLKLQLIIHEFKGFEDAVALVDVANVKDITILCPIGPDVLRFWIERLRAHRDKKWTGLRALRMPYCSSALELYKLISNIPSLEYLECKLDPHHVSQVPALRQVLTPVDDDLDNENCNISLQIMNSNTVSRRPSYNNKPSVRRPMESLFKVTFTHNIPKPTPLPRPRKKPKLKHTTVKSFFGFS